MDIKDDSTEERPEFENALLSDLHEKTDDELRQILDELCEEEKKLSYRRRILHGKIDILRAELIERLKKRRKAGQAVISGKDVERLTEILAKGITGHDKI